jgi:uncharacterized membrane protein
VGFLAPRGLDCGERPQAVGQDYVFCFSVFTFLSVRVHAEYSSVSFMRTRGCETSTSMTPHEESLTRSSIGIKKTMWEARSGRLTISTFCDTFFNTFLMNLSKTTYRVILIGSFVWCLLIVFPPFADHFDAVMLRDFLYGFFSRICHQLDSHSLHLFGAKFAVCARCTAIYFGFLISVAAYPFLSRKIRAATRTKAILRSPRLVILSILPIFIDVCLSEIGVHESTVLTRAVTGAILGIALPYVLIPPAQEAVAELRLKLPLSLLGKIRHAE